MADQTAQIAALTQQLKGLTSDVNTFWTFFGTVLVFWMHAGFSILEAGSIRAKNVQNILFKNLLVVSLTTLLWWFWGYSFAFGLSDTDGFIGGADSTFYTISRLNPAVKSWDHWLFQWAFAATAITIISGAMAERVHMICFLVIVFVINVIVYPPVAHWCWSDYGWLIKRGFSDFAGSGVVHAVGGVSAFVGSCFIGQRRGTIAAHSIPLVVLGTFILWMGWFGFNGASGSIAGDGNAHTTGRVLVNTTIASSTAGLMTIILFYIKKRKLPVDQFCNGLLAGLVSITAGCNAVEDWAAFIIGALGAVFYFLTWWGLTKFKIDDAIFASAVHGSCGIWGVIATGLFHMEGGAFYFPKGPHIFWWNLCGIVVIAAWSAFWTTLICLACKFLKVLKYSKKIQDRGIDVKYHCDPEIARRGTVTMQVAEAESAKISTLP